MKGMRLIRFAFTQTAVILPDGFVINAINQKSIIMNKRGGTIYNLSINLDRKCYFLITKYIKKKQIKIDLLYINYLKEIEQYISQHQFNSIFPQNKKIELAFIKFQVNPFSLNKKQLDFLVNFQRDIVQGYQKVIRDLKFVISQCEEMIARVDQIIYSFSTQDTLKCIQQQVNSQQKQKIYQPIGQFLIKNLSFGARISPNEQYLVFSNQKGHLQLNQTYSCRNLGTISQKIEIDLVSFTQNSKQIILCQNGGMKIFRIGRIFKLQSTINLNEQLKITKLIIIDSNQILVKQQEKTIIIKDLVNLRQNLKLAFSQKCALEIDYDQERQEIIICQKNEICIYSIHGKLLLVYYLQIQDLIDKVQKIKNSNQILISANHRLYLMKVDYQLKSFILIHQFARLQYKYFSLLCKNSTIAFVGEYQITMLDFNLNKIQLIPFYNSFLYVQSREYQQQDDVNFIILQGQSTLEIIRLSDPK